MVNEITLTQTANQLHSLTIRPNANGDTIELTTECGQNFQCVDEVIPDGYTTINYASAGVGVDTDLYELEDHTTETGTIVQVNCYAVVNPINVTGFWSNAIIKTHGTEYVGEKISEPKNTWTTVPSYFHVNPYTSEAWTWDEIDALQCGVQIYTTGSIHPVTQVYAVVYYTVPSVTDCTLTAPEEVSDDHSQNVKMLNLWNGERIVFGLSRSKWGLVLTGREWYDGACEKIMCVQDLGLDGLPITIGGLNNINWDGDWRIISFGWKIINECPEHIEWMLELEKYE